MPRLFCVKTPTGALKYLPAGEKITPRMERKALRSSNSKTFRKWCASPTAQNRYPDYNVLFVEDGVRGNKRKTVDKLIGV